MQHLLRLLLISLLTCLAIVKSYAESRALLIGINDYKYIGDLNGTHNDVEIMNETLLKYAGFESSQIKILLDEHASYAGIQRGFQDWLISGTSPGDDVFFYFSGHGSYIQDLNGDEKDDQYDELLCTWDLIGKPIRPMSIQERNILLDDEINTWLTQLQGRRVTFIIDSCHSGTIQRTFVEENTEDIKEASRFVHVASTFNSRSFSDEPELKGTITETATPGVDFICVSACQPNQTAVERIFRTKYGNRLQGVLTYSLTETVKQRSGNDNWRNIAILVDQRFKNLGVKQILHISTSTENVLENRSFKVEGPEVAFEDVSTSTSAAAEQIRQSLDQTGIDWKSLCSILISPGSSKIGIKLSTPILTEQEQFNTPNTRAAIEKLLPYIKSLDRARVITQQFSSMQPGGLLLSSESSYRQIKPEELYSIQVNPSSDIYPLILELSLHKDVPLMLYPGFENNDFEQAAVNTNGLYPPGFAVQSNWTNYVAGPSTPFLVLVLGFQEQPPASILPLFRQEMLSYNQFSASFQTGAKGFQVEAGESYDGNGYCMALFYGQDN